MTTTCKCKRCGYEWAARVEKPKACPECKRRDWDKLLKTMSKDQLASLHRQVMY